MIKQNLKEFLYRLIKLIDMIFYYILSKFYKNKLKYKNIWLICERGTEAKDNGYVFFKYLREKHPEINAYYLIDRKYKKDYEKVRSIGSIIQYGSCEHKIAFMLCKYAISTHTGYVECWNYNIFKKLLDRKNKKKYIFLQHGITKDDVSEHLNKRSTNIDLFITATNEEYKSIILNSNYGYKDGEVVKTGFARFDLLKNDMKNQILLMPTWRTELEQTGKGSSDNGAFFLQSEYYKRFNALIKNQELKRLLEEKNLKLIFYPHYEMQKYLKYFSINDENIIIASKEAYDVQTLLKQSKLLITDYSSVFFDFAYMKKPVIYYQFDASNYKQGYFSFERDGFGPIINDEHNLIKEIEKVINNDFIMENTYKARVEGCFSYIDNNNCERIYNEIKKL